MVKFGTLHLQSRSRIPQNPMHVDEEGMPQPASQPTQAPSSTRLTQASQIHSAREETAGNHRAEVFEQTKPTLYPTVGLSATPVFPND